MAAGLHVGQETCCSALTDFFFFSLDERRLTDSMTSLQRTRPSIPVVLVLGPVLVLALARSVQALRSDRGLVPEENLGVTVNVTVLDGRGNTVHVMSSDDGTYGQNSPKVDSRGVVIAPAPHHGGNDITHRRLIQVLIGQLLKLQHP